MMFEEVFKVISYFQIAVLIVLIFAIRRKLKLKNKKFVDVLKEIFR